MVFPENTSGAIEITIPNLITPARTDQNSLIFGRFQYIKISIVANVDASTARNGLIEIIVCISTFHQIDVINIDSLSVSEYGKYDCKPYRSLSSGYSHNHKCKYMTIHVV